MAKLLSVVGILAAIFVCGYYIGSQNKKIEYITKEVEVVKYVDKEKSAIYSASNITRDTAIRLLENNQF
ncbi:MAG: hypothetical protein IJ298_08810 [Ruminococcus sp.]|nr:hypothetical protein [Ruminococcus sp.]